MLAKSPTRPPTGLAPEGELERAVEPTDVPGLAGDGQDSGRVNAHFLDERILVLMPNPTEARDAVNALVENGFEALVCTDMAMLVSATRRGFGAMLVAEESLTEEQLPVMVDLLKAQPSWSDFSVVVITSTETSAEANARISTVLLPNGNITLLEKPFRLITLVSALQVALRARRRQYQVRALLLQHEWDQQQLRSHASGLESRVAERTAELRNTITELEAFAYTISHDLRSPLRAINAHAHFLIEDCDRGNYADCREYAERIQNSTARLEGLVQDVLAYSRVSRGAIHLHALDLEMLVRQIVNESPAFQAPRARVEMSLPLHPVVGHAPSLGQCVSNLLENAVKFVDPGTVPFVRVRTETLGDRVRLWIEDNGIGIAPELQGSIFNMFERAHPNVDYEGSGIGLAIVKKAVQRMNGSLGVVSAPGAGSRFWIELPRADGSPEEESAGSGDATVS